MVKSLNIIGAGKLGQTLAKLWVDAGLVTVSGVINQTVSSTEKALAFIGEGMALSSLSQLPLADLTLIATPDNCLDAVSLKLAKETKIKTNGVIFHCSGALSSLILSPLAKLGAFVASMHPMRSFATPSLSIVQFPGTYCAMEGDDEAVSQLIKLLSPLGANCFNLEANKKALYHTAGAFASNYVVALCQQSIDCLVEAGIASKLAEEITTNLIQGTVANLAANPNPAKMLTGPIQRGDVDTVKRHLESLQEPQKTLYQKLGMASLALSCLDETIYQQLAALLSEY